MAFSLKKATMVASSNNFTFDPALEEFNVSQDDFVRASEASVEHVAVGAFIFNPKGDVLLMCRAAKGTFEVPGGMVDRQDSTILHAVAREVQKQTNLQVTNIRRQIGLEDLGKTGSGNKTLKYSFIIDVDGFEVRFDPKEHRDFVWASEWEVEDGCCDVNILKFTTADQREVLLDAFQCLQEEEDATLIKPKL